MAGFSADGVVEALEFSLRPFADVAGVIPEPSPAQVRAFIKAGQDEIRKVAARMAAQEKKREAAEGEGEPGMSALTEAVLDQMAFRGESLSPEALKRQAAQIAALCSGTPSADDLLKLPYRVMQAFSRWVAAEVLDPEAEAGAGNGQVLSLPSAAAG